MSYFAVISGATAASLEISDGRLVPITKALPYVAALASKIEALDGGPSFLWEDDETGTSDENICAFEGAALDGKPLDESPLYRILNSCQSGGATIRVWRANEDLESYRLVPEVWTADEAFSLLQAQALGSPARVGFALHPGGPVRSLNWSSDPTDTGTPVSAAQLLNFGIQRRRHEWRGAIDKRLSCSYSNECESRSIQSRMSGTR
jgi:hypothetical protein